MSSSDSNELIRLSKRMSELGLCSRREADELIAQGLVKVDGQIVNELGFKVHRNQKVSLLQEAKKQLDKLVTILLNKPIGYVSGTPEKNYEPAVRLITPENQDPNYFLQELKLSHLKGIAPAGRLDIDSQGLIVFTQDGKVAKKLIGKEHDIEKEYLVRVHGRLDEKGLQLLNHGLELDGKPLLPAKVEWLNKDQLRFVLKEGKKRQIRRMCELVGLQVVGLKRVRIGKVRLGDLQEGRWRYLRPGESFD